MPFGGRPIESLAAPACPPAAASTYRRRRRSPFVIFVIFSAVTNLDDETTSWKWSAAARENRVAVAARARGLCHETQYPKQTTKNSVNSRATDCGRRCSSLRRWRRRRLFTTARRPRAARRRQMGRVMRLRNGASRKSSLGFFFFFVFGGFFLHWSAPSPTENGVRLTSPADDSLRFLKCDRIDE